MWTPQIATAIDHWKKTGIFPIPSLRPFAPALPCSYSDEDLRLIYQVASLYHQHVDKDNFAIWASHIPTYTNYISVSPCLVDLADTRLGCSPSGLRHHTSCMHCSRSPPLTLHSSSTHLRSTDGLSNTEVQHLAACTKPLAFSPRRRLMPSWRHHFSSPGRPHVGEL